MPALDLNPLLYAWTHYAAGRRGLAGFAFVAFRGIQAYEIHMRVHTLN